MARKGCPVEAKERREWRAFTPAYKAEVVELCRSGHASIGKVARDLDLSETGWVAQAIFYNRRRLHSS